MIQYSFYPTDNQLSNYIFSYGHLTIESDETTPLSSPPNGLTGFLMRYESEDSANVIAKDFEGNSIAEQPYYVIGQTSFPIVGEYIGKMNYLVVFFQPLGLHEFFGCEMSQLTNKSFDLIGFLANFSGEKLINDIKLSPDIETKIQILNSFFLKILPKKKMKD